MTRKFAFKKSLEMKPMGPAISVEVASKTDVGRVREGNEDAMVTIDLRTGLLPTEVGSHGVLLCVCDGMGGAAAGEVASRIATETLRDEMISTRASIPAASVAARLVYSVEDANARIRDHASRAREHRGMGTTCTAAVVVGDQMFVAQVGDSRAYVLRSGRLVQVTRDQSYAGQMVEAGQMTQEQADAMGHGNVLLQALGSTDDVQVVLSRVELRRGDVVLVCSDGLTSMLAPSALVKVLQGSVDSREACGKLVAEANRAGGEDNITCIVARFDGRGLHRPKAGEAVEYRKYES